MEIQGVIMKVHEAVLIHILINKVKNNILFLENV